MLLDEALQTTGTTRFFRPDADVGSLRGRRAGSSRDDPSRRRIIDNADRFAQRLKAMGALGYPEKGFPKKLKRRPLEEIAFVDELGRSIKP